MKTLFDEINSVVEWLNNYAESSARKSFVIGVSGGVDSGLVSTLCAMTGLPTVVVTLPCHSKVDGIVNAETHVAWLKNKFATVKHIDMDLTHTFNTFKANLPFGMVNSLGYANVKSRLRMIALYHVATVNNGLVVGTGNKVEDFGVGFFTKYGDGGVDISPIADFTKSEVRTMALLLRIPNEVATAVPTDGLWDDNRTDETQLGASYAELEWAIDYVSGKIVDTELTPRKQEVLKIYLKWHNITAHKMAPIPTYRRL